MISNIKSYKREKVTLSQGCSLAPTFWFIGVVKDRVGLFGVSYALFWEEVELTYSCGFFVGVSGALIDWGALERAI